MRILQFVPSLSAKDGGTTTYLQQLLPALSVGNELAICCLRPRSKDAVPVSIPGVSLYFIEGRLTHIFAMRREWRCLLEQFQPDVLHIHGCWLPQSACVQHWFRAWHRERLVVLTPHGMLEPWILHRHYLTRKWPAIRLYQRAAVRDASVLVATCAEEMAHLQALHWNENICCIGTGIDSTTIEMKSRWRAAKQLLFMSRIHPKKGLELMLDAMHRLQEKNTADAAFVMPHLCVAGQGDAAYVDSVERYSKTVGMADHCSFIGPVYGADKWTLIRDADVVVLPSYSENFGLIIAEALASGTPVITTTGTPWHTVCEAQCGWCVAPDEQALTGALQDALQTPAESLEQMGRRGRHLIETRYDVRHTALQLQQLYRTLCCLILFCLPFLWQVGGQAISAAAFASADLTIELISLNEEQRAQASYPYQIPVVKEDSMELGCANGCRQLIRYYNTLPCGKETPLAEVSDTATLSDIYDVWIDIYDCMVQQPGGEQFADFRASLLYQAAAERVNHCGDTAVVFSYIRRAATARLELIASSPNPSPKQFSHLAEIRCLEGWMMEQQGETGSALSTYEKALQKEIQLYTKDPRTHLPVMSSLLKQIIKIHERQNNEKAVAQDNKDLEFVLSSLCRLMPDKYGREMALFHMNRAIALGNKSDFGASVERYGKSIAIYIPLAQKDDHYDYHLVMALLYRGYDQWKIGHVDKSMVDLDQAIAISRKHGRVTDDPKYRRLTIQGLVQKSEIEDIYFNNIPNADTDLAEAVSISKQLYDQYKNATYAGELCEVWSRHVKFMFRKHKGLNRDLRDASAAIITLSKQYPQEQKCNDAAKSLSELGF